jgi:pantoate kinase
MKQSRRVSVPSGVSSFFEICDRTSEGKRIKDPLRVGARGGGFIIEKGTSTVVRSSAQLKRDEIRLNDKLSPEALTSQTVVNLVRRDFKIPFVSISHTILPPIGQGFGTSGAGALATAIAINDLFDLKFSLSKAAEYAHVAEINNLTGLGTVISLASGTGAIGLVTEPGTYSVGRTDAILTDADEFTLVCAVFGPVRKSPILSNERSRLMINRFGKSTLRKILEEPTPTRLLSESRVFSEQTGLASSELLRLSEKAVKSGAIGSTPNMIGDAIHSLVEKKQRNRFIAEFSRFISKEFLFESDIVQIGPRIGPL